MGHFCTGGGFALSHVKSVFHLHGKPRVLYVDVCDPGMVELLDDSSQSDDLYIYRWPCCEG